MKCFVCGAPTAFAFAKTYTEEPFATFMTDIGEVRYERCPDCGFTISRTHAELDAARWQQLNQDFHHHLEDPDQERLNNQPPYAEQALMLAMLSRHGVVDMADALDFAAGYGTLSRLLGEYFGIELPIHDPFISGSGTALHIQPGAGRTFNTVINSAMFEHVTCREDLDQVDRLVSSTGCLILHTVVCERVPNDPDWFYIRIPVHTAFHTNGSMQRLMEQWGYRSSLYCPPSKCWVLFRDPPADTAARLAALNRQLQAEWFIYKEGFVDYWKGF